MVTVLIPAKGDISIRRTMLSLIQQGIAPIEILILRNGAAHFISEQEYWHNGAYPGIEYRVIYINECGKGHALNIGINSAKYDYIAVVDADCRLKENALQTALTYFSSQYIMAVGGHIAAVSDSTWLGKLQAVEYEKAFNISRILYNHFNADCLISGAFGIFRKCALKAVHGYRENTVGEDMDLILRIQKLFYHKGHNAIAYASDAVCYTDTPRTLKQLLHQRDRWQRGLLDCLIHSRCMVGNPHYGLLGMLILPYQLVIELSGPLLWIIMNIYAAFACSPGAYLRIIYISYVIGFAVNFAFSVIADSIEKRGGRAGHNYIILLSAADVFIKQIILAARLWGMLSYIKRPLSW